MALSGEAQKPTIASVVEAIGASKGNANVRVQTPALFTESMEVLHSLLEDWNHMQN